MGIRYRPEIDGLRAIAVTSVVFFHAFPNWLTGGFIGVDIFFVISGYLITSIILSEMTDGSFSFLGFYERRARRILPPLFAVMISTIPLAWMMMLPKAAKEYSISVVSSLFFSSNFWFLSEDSYWAEPSQLKPFLHTWSLSVEEQFYFIFPFLMLILFKFLSANILRVLIYVALLLVVLTEFLSHSHTKFAFYMLPTRGWELWTGVIVAVLEVKNYPPLNRYLIKTLPLCGLLMMMFSIVFFDETTRHPSIITLIPIIGSAFIIRYSVEGCIIKKLLSNKFLVGIGLISYGLYLWHYPIFAFSLIGDSFSSILGKFILILGSLILSIFSFYLIERPFRNNAVVSKKTLISLLSFSFIAIFAFNFVSIATDGEIWRYEKWQLNFFEKDRGKNGTFANYVETKYNLNAKDKAFSSSSKPKLLIIGDSFSQDFYNVLLESGLLKDIEISAHYIPTNCKNIPSYYSHILSEVIASKDQTSCNKIIRLGSASLNNKIAAADAVMVASNWDDFAVDYIVELQDIIQQNGAGNTVFIGKKSFPTLTSYELSKLNIDSIRNLKKAIDVESFNVIGRMKKIESLKLLDIHGLICGDSIYCPVSTPEGYLISYDGGHLTREGAVYVGNLLLKNERFVNFWHSFSNLKL